MLARALPSSQRGEEPRQPTQRATENIRGSDPRRSRARRRRPSASLPGSPVPSARSTRPPLRSPPGYLQQQASATHEIQHHCAAGGGGDGEVASHYRRLNELRARPATRLRSCSFRGRIVAEARRSAAKSSVFSANPCRLRAHEAPIFGPSRAPAIATVMAGFAVLRRFIRAAGLLQPGHTRRQEPDCAGRYRP